MLTRPPTPLTEKGEGHVTTNRNLWECDECGEVDEHGSVCGCQDCTEQAEHEARYHWAGREARVDDWAGPYWQCVECDREHNG